MAFSLEALSCRVWVAQAIKGLLPTINDQLASVSPGGYGQPLTHTPSFCGSSVVSKWLVIWRVSLYLLSEKASFHLRVSCFAGTQRVI
jgi:hypothetical protein